jgi:hypothetical protein
MFTIAVTKYNAGEGIETMLYTDVNQYKITDDYLILEHKPIGSIVYIQKDQVLEFEVNW